MLLAFILVVSCAAFLTQKMTFHRYGKFQSRRGITGYEIARHILDANGYENLIVGLAESSDAPRRGLSSGFDLPAKVGKSTSFSDIARAAWETVLLLKTQQSAPLLGLATAFKKFLVFVIWCDWILLAASFAGPGWGSLRPVSVWGFGLVFFAAFFDIVSEWELSNRAKASLKKFQYFEVDEWIRLKKILKCMRWSRFAQIFEVPLGALGSILRFPRRRKEK
ncbi:MAG: zinc metallopeptidase [Candidatus Omnitrophica bacterium]|nr:zinc metallopeptidase [Candidatus Omnitrophota bacterium]